MVRVSALSGDSAFSYAVRPVDPMTGQRGRRNPVTVIDDADEVDAYFARQGGA